MTKAVIIRTTHGTARSVRSRRYYVVRSMPSWVYVNYKGEDITMPAGVEVYSSSDSFDKVVKTFQRMSILAPRGQAVFVIDSVTGRVEKSKGDDAVIASLSVRPKEG